MRFRSAGRIGQPRHLHHDAGWTIGEEKLAPDFGDCLEMAEINAIDGYAFPRVLSFVHVIVLVGSGWHRADEPIRMVEGLKQLR